jgi:circadian clock protein KaiC
MGGGDSNGMKRAATGIPGLDLVLDGGLPAGRLYFVQGDPGAGKTTLGLQFLLEGARRGEAGIFATLSESEADLRDIAGSHGWQLDGVIVCELQSPQQEVRDGPGYTLFHPAEVELGETARALLDAVERVRPSRVVIDSLSEMRLLARDPLRYRRQILSFKQHLGANGCTVLLLNYLSDADVQLQSLAHGLITLEHLAQAYGGERRRLRIEKLRGVAFREGHHDFSIRRGGIVVYPRLVAAEHPRDGRLEAVGSGIAELDALLGGGIARGTSTMLMGPSGVGKTTIASQYAVTAAGRGERAVIYLFDELPSVWTKRCEGLGMEVQPLISRGLIELRRVDPAELSPGELAHAVHQEVEQGARMVIIDSLNGYQNAMPEERFLGLHLRELLSYLDERGVLTLMMMTEHGVVGTIVESSVQLTYLADNVLMLRYFEAFGEVRQAISVVKKRTGSHERTIRELRLGPHGPEIGRALTDFQGVLGGDLTYVGGREPLLGQLAGAEHG